jgi:hypothetical protein
MPLTPAGRRTLRTMVSQYGAKRGKAIFFAKSNQPGEEAWKKAVFKKKARERKK